MIIALPEDITIDDLLKSIQRDVEANKYDDALIKLIENKSQLNEGTYWLSRGILEKKIGNYAQSRFSLEKSKNIIPYQMEVYKELSEVEGKLNVEALERMETLSDYLHRGATFLPESVLLTVFLIVFSLFGILSKMAGGVAKWIVIFILGLALSLSGKIYKYYYNIGIVEDAVQVREGPSKMFPFHMVIPKGTKIVLKEEGNWFRIVYPSQFSGWSSEIKMNSLY